MYSAQDIDLLLLSCPSKVIDYPCLSLPALTGFLRKNSISVSQRDINIEVKDALISADSLNHLYRSILPLLIRLNTNNKENYTKLREFYKLLDDINSSHGFAELEKIKIKCQMREYKFLNDKVSFSLLETIFKVSKFCDFFFSFIYEYFELFEKNNITFFLIRYLKHIIKDIISMRPRVIGLTIITTQNKFTLWFADYLKKNINFNVFILLGGAQATKFEEQYLYDNAAVDFVISGEGEYPLLQLMREIKKDSPKFDKIPRLSFRKNNEIVKNGNFKYLDECYQATFPEYEGFLLDKYLSPVLPVLASSNCPWKKCKFCAHRTSFKENYNERDPKNVVDEMEYMYEKYGTTLFHFADETISAGQGAKIGELIAARGLPFLWMSFGRLDEEFNEMNIKQWYEGGARVVEWGLESASDKVLEKMNKGITVGKAQEILQIAGRMGIKNKLLTWHNYPGESLEDLLKTIKFVRKNVHQGFAAPMLTLKQKLVLQVGSELYNEIFQQKSEEKLFKKVWLPASIYSINASYLSLDNSEEGKLAVISPYIRELEEYCLKNNIFIASNENISFDLILCQIQKG